MASDLLDAIAEATDHEPCDLGHCLLCEGITGDTFTLLQGLERAIGDYVVAPGAHDTAAGEAVREILAHLHGAPAYRRGPVPAGSKQLAPHLTDHGALRLYAFLKGVSMDLTLGSGWPRIET